MVAVHKIGGQRRDKKQRNHHRFQGLAVADQGQQHDKDAGKYCRYGSEEGCIFKGKGINLQNIGKKCQIVESGKQNGDKNNRLFQ